MVASKGIRAKPSVTRYSCHIGTQREAGSPCSKRRGSAQTAFLNEGDFCAAWSVCFGSCGPWALSDGSAPPASADHGADAASAAAHCDLQPAGRSVPLSCMGKEQDVQLLSAQVRSIYFSFLLLLGSKRLFGKFLGLCSSSALTAQSPQTLRTLPSLQGIGYRV